MPNISQRFWAIHPLRPRLAFLGKRGGASRIVLYPTLLVPTNYPAAWPLPIAKLFALLLLFGVLFHDGARRDLFGAFAVAPGFLGRFFDMFVLALFF